MEEPVQRFTFGLLLVLGQKNFQTFFLKNNVLLYKKLFTKNTVFVSSSFELTRCQIQAAAPRPLAVARRLKKTKKGP